MCRHLGYLGPPVTLHALAYAPPRGLYEQSYAPRHQAHGTVNADGFGVGWYGAGSDGAGWPARYRRAMPIWADSSFAEAATAITATCVVAAVRDATPGFAGDECCAQPFRAGRLLFSHNGAVSDDAAVAARLGWPLPENAMDARAPVDSAPLFAHAARLWQGGSPLAAALAGVVRDAQRISEGRYNLLASDGQQLVATAAGDSLFVGRWGGGLCVASEPFDDDVEWQRVPDGSVVTARGATWQVTTLADVAVEEDRCSALNGT